jgi:hypothetical protein
MTKIEAGRGKLYRRKHDNRIMGKAISLGVDYSTGTPRQDLESYYEQIDNPVETIVIEMEVPVNKVKDLKPVIQEWKPGEKVYAKDGDKAADVRIYRNKLYRVVQAHTTAVTWEPDKTPALWKVFTPAGVIPDWVQPQGAHDAYQIGDKVKFDSKTWICTVANNVWQPGVYGWEEIT